MNIRKSIKNYFNKKSLFSIISDFVFVIIILLLLIPVTRKETMSFFIRSTLFIKSPSFKAEKEIDNAYQWELKGINTNDTVVKFNDAIVFINFWATWCSPCRAEMPSLQKLYKEFQNDIVFLFVSNENEKAIKDYLQKTGYTMPIYISKKVPQDLSSNTLPTTFVVNKNKIILEKKGAMNWNSRNFKEELGKLLIQP